MNSYAKLGTTRSYEQLCQVKGTPKFNRMDGFTTVLSFGQSLMLPAWWSQCCMSTLSARQRVVLIQDNAFWSNTGSDSSGAVLLADVIHNRLAWVQRDVGSVLIIEMFAAGRSKTKLELWWRQLNLILSPDSEWLRPMAHPQLPPMTWLYQLVLVIDPDHEQCYSASN